MSREEILFRGRDQTQTGESLFKGSHLGNLRSQMTLHTNNVDVGKSSCRSIKISCFGQTYAELVLLHPGGDVWVCAGIDVRIRANRNARTAVHILGDCVDQFELGAGFHIEEKNAGAERIANLVCGFADAGKNHLPGRPAGTQHAEQFTTGHESSHSGTTPNSNFSYCE